MSDDEHELTCTVVGGTLKATTPNREGDGLDWYTVGLLPGDEWVCTCGETFVDERDAADHLRDVR